jgi:hypothetical protein
VTYVSAGGNCNWPFANNKKAIMCSKPGGSNLDPFDGKLKLTKNTSLK